MPAGCARHALHLREPWSSRRCQRSPAPVPLIIAKTSIQVFGSMDMGAAVASAARHLDMQVLGVRRSAVAHDMADETFPVDQLARRPKFPSLGLCQPYVRQPQC